MFKSHLSVKGRSRSLGHSACLEIMPGQYILLTDGWTNVLKSLECEI